MRLILMQYIHCVQKKAHPYVFFYIFVENV